MANSARIEIVFSNAGAADSPADASVGCPVQDNGEQAKTGDDQSSQGSPQDMSVDIPPSEDDFIDATEHVVRMLATSFPFGYYDLDDIRQEARLFAWRALPRFEAGRNLRNFLFIHVRNRLLNLQRDKSFRNEPPCPLCHVGEFCQKSDGGVGASPTMCKDYADWFRRNTSKSNLMRPGAWSDAVAAQHYDRHAEGPAEAAAKTEIWAMLDSKMPHNLRADYQKVRDGLRIPKARKEAVLEMCRSILGVVVQTSNGQTTEDWETCHADD